MTCNLSTYPDQEFLAQLRSDMWRILAQEFERAEGFKLETSPVEVIDWILNQSLSLECKSRGQFLSRVRRLVRAHLTHQNN